MRAFLLAGDWTRCDEVRAVTNPYSGEAIAEVCVPGWEHVDRALDAAVAAFDYTRAQPAHERCAQLTDAAAEMTRRRDELVSTIVAEAGKPVRQAAVEADRAISTITWAAEEAKRFSGELIRLDTAASSSGRLGLARRFAVGPVLGITPFNFPLNLVCHKVGPALAVGNPVVVKPASATPLSALLLGEVLIDSGVEDGVSVLPCAAADAERAAADPRVAKVSFTGSGEVGWRLKERAARKPVTLELGGNAAVIVEADADVERAADRVAFGGFYQAGQSCISVQRVFVQEAVYPAFLDALVTRVQALVVGDPADEATDVGPLIDAGALERVDAWVREALDAGAKAVCGARRDDPCYAPTVLVDVDPSMKVSCREVFGPVVTVQPYGEFAEAITMVNDSEYGLQAGVFTNDVQKVFLAHRDLRVGGVIHDDVSAFRADQMPYGGVKDSGYGREGVRYAMQEMTELRVLVLSGLEL